MNKTHLFPKGETVSSTIWLLFLLIPAMHFFPYETFESQFAGILLVFFALCYRNTLFRGKFFVYWIVFQYMIGLFYMLVFGYVYLFMFPAWQIGFSKVRKSTFWLLYGTMIVLMIYGFFFGPISNSAFGGDQLITVIAFSLFTAIAPLSGKEFHRQQEHRKQLYQANKRMEAVIKGEERNRIARDLHDSLGQSLSVITIKLDLAQKMLAKDPGMVAGELKEIEGLSRSTLKTVREIVSDMRKRTIAEELIEINLALTAAKIILATEKEETARLLSGMQQTELSSILREAVTNIIRHSKASFCSIAFSQASGWMNIKIRDNGVGPKEIVSGNGIAGMKERVRRMNGAIAVEDDKGTVISVSIPIKEAADD